MADFGNNDNSLLARTHLGAVLHPGKCSLIHHKHAGSHAPIMGTNALQAPSSRSSA